jgi:hypothetical protein
LITRIIFGDGYRSLSYNLLTTALYASFGATTKTLYEGVIKMAKGFHKITEQQPNT